jgi:hypothetical protein
MLSTMGSRTEKDGQRVLKLSKDGEIASRFGGKEGSKIIV